jgi:hypothetical protein
MWLRGRPPAQPWQQVLLEAIDEDLYALQRTVLPSLALFVLWPWLTFASLLVYSKTMRQAKIRRVHVWRCVVYSAGGGGLLIAAIIALAPVVPSPNFDFGGWLWAWGLTMDLSFVAVLLLVISFLTYRLVVAYRRYLRFPHATPAVVASQVILVLIVIKGYMLWSGF